MAKIINAVFGGGLFATTAKVFQYDVGDKLRFLGVDLPEGYSVDFANSRTGASTTVLGDADGVEIPPEYFIPGTEIYAWVVISDADGHYTKYQAKIPIYERAARTSVEPTPAQADALDEAINALNSAVEDVQDIADNLNDQIDQALAEAKASGEFDGEDGYSPTVAVTAIEGGHRVTITDATHPAGQSFDVLDGESGSGGSGIGYVGYGEDSYADIQDMLGADLLPICIYDGLQLQYIGETELAGDLGFLFAAYSPDDGTMVTATCLDGGEWSHQSIPIPAPAQSTVYDRPKMDGTVSVGSSTRYARADHVHPKDTSKLDLDQGTANAGKFLVVGSDGNITTVTMTAWQGGSY